MVREKGRLGAARRILTPFGVRRFIAALDGKIYFLALVSPIESPVCIPPPPHLSVGEGMNPLVQSNDKSHALQDALRLKKKGTEATSLSVV